MRFYGVADKMTRRLAGAVIGIQSLVLALGALVAWALAPQDGGHRTTYLVGGLVLAALCILAAGSMRRPWGITLGWLIEIATLLAAFVVPMMAVVGLIFGALWITALVQGSKMDALTAEYTRSHG